MQRAFTISPVDRNHRLVECSVYDCSECVALFTCVFEGESIKTFHADSFRPSAINVGMEYQIFITRAFRMVREGLTADEASILEI